MDLCALIISIVALMVAILALPTLAQMVWGRPAITLLFRREEKGNIIRLFCEIINQPIDNSFLKKLGVYRRSVDNLSIIFSIEDMTKEEIVVANIIGEIHTAHDHPKSSISLPSSIFPAEVELVNAGVNGHATTVAHYEAKNIELPPGKYRVIVMIQASENIIEFSQEFSVAREQGIVILKPESK